jgi:hypothetical protein
MATVAQVLDRHHVSRMVEGLFVGPGQTVGGMPRQFLNAVLPVLSANAEHDREFIGLDLYQRVTEGQPRDWEWRAISELGRYSWGHTIGLDLGEVWKFVTWAYGAPRTYAVVYASPIEPDDIAAAYGPEATRRAWPQDKAVQLKLTRIP